MVNPRMPTEWTLSLGESAEKLADIYDISREAQDAFALRSHQLADKAYSDGTLIEVVPVPGVELTRDEGIRTDTSLESSPRSRRPSSSAGR
jgi:acetyl-CoA acetyltransferase